jgi:hypothetical protein
MNDLRWVLIGVFAVRAHGLELVTRHRLLLMKGTYFVTEAECLLEDQQRKIER